MNAARRDTVSFRTGGHSAAPAWPFAFAAVASFGAVAAALVTQHVYAMDPCPWCVLERLLFVVIGLFALLGLLWRSAIGSRLAGTFILLLAIAGMAATMWQHFVAAKSASCNLTLADRIMTASQLDRLLPGVFEARASCADAAVTLAGIPYDFLAAAVFLACAIAMIRALRRVV
ncbi:MAG: disulfide bond formation protein B [Pseudomonadota bacterium]|nr:disulfide bond formation protein B [Pseudomonadota bacterium]